MSHSDGEEDGSVTEIDESGWSSHVNLYGCKDYIV